jgi:hypothetical protein
MTPSAEAINWHDGLRGSALDHADDLSMVQGGEGPAELRHGMRKKPSPNGKKLARRRKIFPENGKFSRIRRLVSRPILRRGAAAYAYRRATEILFLYLQRL